MRNIIEFASIASQKLNLGLFRWTKTCLGVSCPEIITLDALMVAMGLALQGIICRLKDYHTHASAYTSEVPLGISAHRALTNQQFNGVIIESKSL
jgi:hypothetical protein